MRKYSHKKIAFLLGMRVLQQYRLDGYRAIQSVQDKARVAGKGYSLVNTCNTVLSALGCSLRANQKVVIHVVAFLVKGVTIPFKTRLVANRFLVRCTYLTYVVGVLGLFASVSTAQAAATITATENNCTARTGGGHASTIMFFGSGIKNVVATTNEFQLKDGAAISKPTNVTFDVWKSNGAGEGECVGNILVQIDGGTNERAEVIVEDLLSNTPTSGSGVLVRTGDLDARKKMDAYVQTESAGKRRIIWNNFTGIPNTSRLMSGLRFASGQHLAIYFTGQNDRQAEANIQVFTNAGKFIGVAQQTIGSHSSVITDDVMSLSYKDLEGKAVPASALPKDGEGYLRILGRADDETEASCMILYTKAMPGVAMGAWDNSKLASTTITYARRNGGNDPLTLGE